MGLSIDAACTAFALSLAWREICWWRSLFEWGQPIPIGIEYLKDEADLRVVITSVNMHPKNIDFGMQDTAFDCVIDVELDASITYTKQRVYVIITNDFVLQ